jgi:hypothetical protein
MTMWHFGKQTLTHWRATPQTRHVRFGPCFIDKNQASRIFQRLVGSPLLARMGDIGPILFGCMERLLLKE